MKKLTKAKKSVNKTKGWVLYHGMYEINWKNGRAHEVAIEGVILQVKYQRKARKLFA